MSDLAEAIDTLLMHNFRPATVVAQNEMGTWDVHLVLDGHYSTREGAEYVIPAWNATLAAVLVAMQPPPQPQIPEDSYLPNTEL